MIPRYYSLVVSETAESNVAHIYIFGDIVVPEYEWLESDTSGFSLSKDIKGLDVDAINVHINSYGGHASEGIAIYNILRQHKAKVTTICDGFACSAASVVFMAGDVRIMQPASLLMVHHAWNGAVGNPNELRKAADDLEIISDTIANAYREHMLISEDELQALLDGETWIPPKEALEYGFATLIAQSGTMSKVAASVRDSLMMRVLGRVQQPAQTLKPEEVIPLVNTPLNILGTLLGERSKNE